MSIQIPTAGENDIYADFISELIETDSYYLGMAFSVVNGREVTIDFHYIEALISTFQTSLTDIEKHKCDMYVKSLCRICDLLQEVKNGVRS
ncbi:hypothetical protein MRX56_09510 [Pseudodesulfovibrio sp. S3-i]|nr:hypothetical protein [Pseudodesulfovibrio sp. S3-i]